MVIIEAKATGTPLTDELRVIGIPVVNYTPSKGRDKHTRMHMVAPIFEAGMVWAPDKSFSEEVIDECAAFPHGDNDDYCDSMSMALIRYRKGGFLQLSSDEEDAPNFINIEKQLDSLIITIGKALKDNENYELLKEGIKVVLTGRPNVGKSSLFNTIIKREKAIVTDIAGTTRDIIESKINLRGYPVVIYDTAGITVSNDRVEKEGIKKAKEVIKEADIVLNVYDSVNYKERIKKNSKWNVLNKIDKMSKSMKVESSTHLVSAKSGEGVEELLNKIYEEILKKTKHLYSADAIISNSRQASELEAALSSIVEARGERAPEILSEHLRQANRSLERILGNIDIEEVLGSIFSKFCIGK